MTKIKSTDLTGQQQELFTECFYDAWRECKEMDEYEPDLKSSIPSGFPWLYDVNLEVDTLNIEKFAEDYFHSIKFDLIEGFKLVEDFKAQLLNLYPNLEK